MRGFSGPPETEHSYNKHGSLQPCRGGYMHRVLILGAGKIGALISGLLAESGSYKVNLGDVDGAAAESVVRAHGSTHLSSFALDASDGNVLLKHLKEHPVD